MVLRDFKPLLRDQSKEHALNPSIRSTDLETWQDNRYSVMVMQQLYENSQGTSGHCVSDQKC